MINVVRVFKVLRDLKDLRDFKDLNGFIKNDSTKIVKIVNRWWRVTFY